MYKGCPVCEVVLIDDSGRCPACNLDCDVSALPEMDTYALARALQKLQRTKAIRASGGGGGGILKGMFRWLFLLSGLGAFGTIAAIDYKNRMDLVGGLAGAGLVLLFISSFFKDGSQAAALKDDLPRGFDIDREITRIEEARLSLGE